MQSLYRHTRSDRACGPPSPVLSDDTLVARNQMHWEYSHHGNQETLQARALFSLL